MAVAFVQGKTNSAASGTSTTVTLGAAPTSGNLLVYFIEHATSTRPTGTPSGSGWSVVVNASGSGGTARAAAYWWKIAGAGESATITYSAIALTAPWSATVVEYSGVDTTSTVNAGPAAATAPSITTTAGAGLVVMIEANRSTTSTTAWSAHAFNGSTTGVTARCNNNQNNQAGTSGLATAWDFIGTLPAATVTGSVTAPTADAIEFGLAAFNAAATGGGAPDFIPGMGVRRRTVKRALPIRMNPGSATPPDIPIAAFVPFRRRPRRWPMPRLNAGSDAPIGQQQLAVTNPSITQTVTGWVRRFGHARRRGGVTSVTPVSPIPTVGLALWLDASAIRGAVDGDPVSSWHDDSGSGRTMVQATGAAQPIYRTGASPSGLPAVRFDGTADFMANTSAISITAGYTMVVAHRVGTIGTGQPVIIEDGDATGGVGFKYDASKVRNELIQNNVDVADGTATDNVAEIWHADGTGLAVHALYINNGTPVTSTSPASANPTAQMTLGTFNTKTASFYPGDIYEVIFYTRRVTATERTNIYNYLLLKWLTPPPFLLGSTLIRRRPQVPARRAHVAAVTPAQAAATASTWVPGLRFARRLTRNRPRAALSRPVAAQDPPASILGRRRSYVPSRRLRVAQVTPPQINPPWLPVVARGLRLIARTVRPSHAPSPVQGQQPLVPNPAITHTAWRTRRLGHILRRPEVGTPTRGQVNPPIVQTASRTRRFGHILRRPEASTPTRTQVNPPIVQTASRARRFGHTLRRPGTLNPAPLQQAQVNPRIVQTASRTRRFGHTLRRPEVANPALSQQASPTVAPVTQRARRFGHILRRPEVSTPTRGQVNPPIVQTASRTRRFGHVLRRPGTAIPTLTQPATPVNPRITQPARRTRRFGHILRRPETSTPTRAQVNPPYPITPSRVIAFRGLVYRRAQTDTPTRVQVNPPYPVKPSRVVAVRGLSRRRGGPTLTPQVQPTAETRAAAQGGLRGLRRIWLKIRRKHGVPVPPAVTTLQGPLVITDSSGTVEADRGGTEDATMSYGASDAISGVYGSADSITPDLDNDGVAGNYGSDSDVL